MTGEQAPQQTLYGQYAGFATRLIAFFIDRLILTVIISVVTIVGRFVTDSLPINEWLGTEQLAWMIVTTLLVLLGVLIHLSYDIGFWLLTGQTPGKRIMGVRIVRSDGERITFGNAVRREIGYFISGILFLGYLWVLLDNRRQAFHDKLAGTLVVYSWPEDWEQVKALEGRARRFRERRGTTQG